MRPTHGSNPWYMAGSEGTGEYVVVARTPVGCVGYRELGHVYRVRVEPGPSGKSALARALTKDAGWKPGDAGQARFSIEVGEDRLRAVLGVAVRALRPSDFRAELNPSAPDWARHLAVRAATRTATQAGGIFISYRRADSQTEVRQMFGHLTATLPAVEVFVDVDSIPLGQPFPNALQTALHGTDVGLIVIGPGWVAATAEGGLRRLHDPADYVRQEIESLLASGAPVIPCLVAGADLPRDEDLPQSIRPLVTRQGFAVRPDPHFDADMDRLTNRLRPLLAAGSV